MTTNQFNTGRDCRLVILHSLARDGRVDLPLVTDFDAKPAFHDIEKGALDGYTRTQHIPKNIMLSFTADRSTPALDDLLAAIWQSYRLTGRVPDGSVYHYVDEIDGSTTTAQYTGVAFKPDDLGSWKKDSAVSQKLSGSAMDFRRL